MGRDEVFYNVISDCLVTVHYKDIESIEQA